MRAINCLLVRIPNNEEKFAAIQFPEVNKTLEELSNVTNMEIVGMLGTHSDPFKHTKTMDWANIIDTYMVKSFQSAIDHYGIITKT